MKKMNQIEVGCDLSFGSLFQCSLTSTYFVYTTKLVLPTNLRRNNYNDRVENRPSPRFAMVIGSACLLISQLDT